MNRFAFVVVVAALVIGAPSRMYAQGSAVADPSDAFFDDTRLHDLRFDIKPRDWDSLREHFLENTYYPVDMSWNGQMVRNIAIRSRGTGSRSGSKPGLRVDIDYNIKGQTFLGLKSFIMRNQSQDPSNIRERVSMGFFRRMGLKAIREAHARLFINGTYFGLYTIIESQDKAFLKKNLGEDTGHLYEYAFDNAAVAAGSSPYVFQFLGSDPKLYVPVPFKPETLEDDPQGDVIAKWVQTINDTGAAWRSMIAEYMDLSKFVRHLAVENFLAEEDGITGDYGPNNFYLYRFVNTNKFQFLPWDKSNTFWESAAYSIFRNVEDGPVDHRNKLVLRIFQEADLRNLYLDTLLECAASADEGFVAGTSTTAATPGFLEKEVTREYDQIRAAALADTVKPFTNEEFEKAIADVKTFARDRAASVRAQVAASRR